MRITTIPNFVTTVAMLDPLLSFIDRLPYSYLPFLLLLVVATVAGFGWLRFSIYLLSTPALRNGWSPRFRSLYNPAASLYFRAGRYHQWVVDWVRKREWSDSSWRVAARLLIQLNRVEGWATRWWGCWNWQDLHLLLLLFGGVYNLLLLPLLFLTCYDTIFQLNGFMGRLPSQQLMEYNPFIRRYLHRFSGPTPFYGWGDQSFFYDIDNPPHSTSYYHSRKTPYRWLKRRTLFNYHYQIGPFMKQPKLAYLFMVGYLGILPAQLYILHQTAKFYTFGIYQIEINTRWLQQVLEEQSRVMVGVVRLNRAMGLWLLFHLPLVVDLLWHPIKLLDYDWSFVLHS